MSKTVRIIRHDHHPTPPPRMITPNSQYPQKKRRVIPAWRAGALGVPCMGGIPLSGVSRWWLLSYAWNRAKRATMPQDSSTGQTTKMPPTWPTGLHARTRPHGHARRRSEVATRYAQLSDGFRPCGGRVIFPPHHRGGSHPPQSFGFCVSGCSKALPLFPELPLSGSMVELREYWERFLGTSNCIPVTEPLARGRTNLGPSFREPWPRCSP